MEASVDVGRGRWVLAIVGALILLVGGGTLASQAVSAPGGGETPEDVVDALITALDNEDFISFAELLAPGERRTIVDPIVNDVVPELVRLGVLDDSFDAARIDLPFDLTGVTYRLEPIDGHPDLMNVFATSGASSDLPTAGNLPLGDVPPRWLGDDLADFLEEVASSTFSPLIVDVDDPVLPDLTVIERDGRWYVSTWFSRAEALRISYGIQPPAPLEQLSVLGAASPEAAVEALVGDVIDVDIEALLGRLDPDEMDVIYHYSPIFLEELRSTSAKVRTEMGEEGFAWDLTGLEVDVDQDGDDAILTIRSFIATVTGPDVFLSADYSPEVITVVADVDWWGEEFDGRVEVTKRRRPSSEGVEDYPRITLVGTLKGDRIAGEVTVDPTGDCASYRFRGSDQVDDLCLEDILVSGGLIESIASFTDRLDSGTVPFLEIKTHRTGGAWFVSPVGTILHDVTNGLRRADPGTTEYFFDSALPRLAFGPLDALFLESRFG